MQGWSGRFLMAVLEHVAAAAQVRQRAPVIALLILSARLTLIGPKQTMNSAH